MHFRFKFWSLYILCSRISDTKLLARYHHDLEEAYEEINEAHKEIQKQKSMLDNKLKLIAIDKNIQQSKENPIQSIDTKPQKEQKIQELLEILNQEDSDELKDLCIEMDGFVAEMFKPSDINPESISKFIDKMYRYAAVLNFYPLFLDLSTGIKKITETLYNNLDLIEKEHLNLAIYFENLQLTLENFRVYIWENEFKDPFFFNASILSDLNTITMAITSVDEIDSDIEFF